MAQLLQPYICVFVCIALQRPLFVHSQRLRGPSNITRTAGETEVFIPCPFEFSPAPSIWRINGSDYSSSTLPSAYSITSGGLVIHTVHKCLDQTSFQCIDTSDGSLTGQESSIGFLTVLSTEPCSDIELELYLNAGPGKLELDHKHIKYGSSNTTLAWSIFPPEPCNTSNLLSFPKCREVDIVLNVTTNNTEQTLSSDSLHISGMPADFRISSLDLTDFSNVTCPRLPDTVRFDVNETEHLKLFMGNNNCTCINIDRLGSLYMAISYSNSSTADIICSIVSYRLGRCNNFRGTPFFRVYDNAPSEIYEMCFGNITMQLNGTRVDLYTLKREVCSVTNVYSARKYLRSIEIQAIEGSANVSVDTKKAKVCFSAQQECDLFAFTEYNTTITDLSGNVVYRNEQIPESTCVTVTNLLQSECAPFTLMTQPINEYIVFGSSSQLITPESTGESSDLCNCIMNNVRLTLHNISEDQSAIIVYYNCFTTYTELVYVTFDVKFDNTTKYQNVTLCSEGSFTFLLRSDSMFGEINLNGFWVNTSGSKCPLLNISHTILPPTVSPVNPTDRIAIALGVTFSILAICLMIICTAVLIALIFKKRNYLVRLNTVKMSSIAKIDDSIQNDLDEHEIKADRPDAIRDLN